MESIETIIENFIRIAAIPRPSKHEEKLSAWLQAWAGQRGLAFKTDSAGNLAIRIPATVGYEDKPIHVLQGHMDMVCEKTPDSDHDFLRDPILCIRDGDWLRADRTTLGADNGIAIAIAMSLAEDQSLSHPALELLFTVEEEIGIGGASQLDPNLISGKFLINLDSEEEGTFIVGCAGGNTTHIHLPISFEQTAGQHHFLRLLVRGLQGGHSGVDIHKHRGNANKILARALDHLQQSTPVQISFLAGGTAHNSMPRQAEAIFTCPKEMSDACIRQISLFEKVLQDEYSGSDAGLRLELTLDYVADENHVLSIDQTMRVIQLLMAMPTGVADMSSTIEGFVETSNNLAIIQFVNNGLDITSSQRSTVMSRLEEVTRRIESIAHLAGAHVDHTGGYPAWQPSKNSALLLRSERVYQKLFGQEPVVKLIHAGLECGIIGERCAGMDMLSLGPTIKNAHSPNEMLYLPSVAKVWQLLVELLSSN